MFIQKGIKDYIDTNDLWENEKNTFLKKVRKRKWKKEKNFFLGNFTVVKFWSEQVDPAYGEGLPNLFHKKQYIAIFFPKKKKKIVFSIINQKEKYSLITIFC